VDALEKLAANMARVLETVDRIEAKLGPGARQSIAPAPGGTVSASSAAPTFKIVSARKHRSIEDVFHETVFKAGQAAAANAAMLSTLLDRIPIVVDKVHRAGNRQNVHQRRHR
jgi:hypothetical protein